MKEKKSREDNGGQREEETWRKRRDETTSEKCERRDRERTRAREGRKRRSMNLLSSRIFGIDLDKPSTRRKSERSSRGKSRVKEERE